MTSLSRQSKLLLLTALAVPAWTGLTAQAPGPATTNQIDVVGQVPDQLTGLTKGPVVEGIISARDGARLEIAGTDGANTPVLVSSATDIQSTGGFLGANRTKLGADSLLNGLPVTIQTMQWEGGLVASRIRLKSSNLATATMIRQGTAQRFAQHDTQIAQNAAATEALRGRFGDIDQYNLRGTTNVYFDTGKWALSPQAEGELCAAAEQAKGMNNALILVVGYTDARGSDDYNQELSEKRAGKVVNFLQQRCGWAPYRMLTPTGMAKADPAADNSTPQGMAQNRRVAINILVSKAVEG